MTAGGKGAAGCSPALKADRAAAAVAAGRRRDRTNGTPTTAAAAGAAAAPAGQERQRRLALLVALLLLLVRLVGTDTGRKGGRPLQTWGPTAAAAASLSAASRPPTAAVAAAAAASFSLVLLHRQTPVLGLLQRQTPWGKREEEEKKKEQQQKAQQQQRRAPAAHAGRLRLQYDGSGRKAAEDEEREKDGKRSSRGRREGTAAEGEEEAHQAGSSGEGRRDDRGVTRGAGGGGAEAAPEDVVFQQQSVEEAMSAVDSRRAQMLAAALDLKYGFDGLPPDPKRAMAAFEEVAAGEKDAATAQALYELGDLYLRGIPGRWGVSRDIDAAVASFEGAAAMGYGPALHALGNAYAMGLGPLQMNEAEATRLQYLASLTDYVPAVLAMGFRHFYGDGVVLDCEAALRHYKFAAERAVLLLAPQLLLPARGPEGAAAAAAERERATTTASGDSRRSLSSAGQEEEEEEGQQQQLGEAAAAAAAAGGVILPPVPLTDADRLTSHSQQQFRDFQAAQQQQEEVLQYWQQRARKRDPMAQYELAKQLEMQQLQQLPQEQQQQPELHHQQVHQQQEKEKEEKGQQQQQLALLQQRQQHCPGGGEGRGCSPQPHMSQEEEQQLSPQSQHPEQPTQRLSPEQQQAASLGLKEKATANHTTKERIRRLLEESAQQGLTPALRDLGLLHLQERQDGTGDNLKKAVDYFKQAAARGDAEAQNYLGYLYYAGASAGECPGGSSSSSAEVAAPAAVAAGETAASQKERCFSLERDTQLATLYFSQAALSEFPEALFFLGELEMEASSKTPPGEKDEERLTRALRYYQRAADGGYVLAAWREAQLLEAGKGVERSCEGAALAYKAIAEAGPWVEDVRRGYLQYVEGDLEGALLTFGFAAEEGYSIAQVNAAFLHRRTRLPGIRSRVNFSRLLSFRKKRRVQQFALDPPPQSEGQVTSNSYAEEGFAATAPGHKTPVALSSQSSADSSSGNDHGSSTRGRRGSENSSNNSNGNTGGSAEAWGSSEDPYNSNVEAGDLEEHAESSTSYPQEYRMVNRAALQGDPAALRSVALAHITGVSNTAVLKSPALAKEVLHMALSLGDIESLPPLASLYEKGDASIPRDLQRAEDMLRYYTEAEGKCAAAGPQNMLRNGGVPWRGWRDSLLHGAEHLFHAFRLTKIRLNLSLLRSH